LRAGVEPDDITGGLSSAPPPGREPLAHWVDADGESVLRIEASDGPGLLMALAKALYQCELTITGSEIVTRNGVAEDRFTLRTRDLAPLDDELRSTTLEKVQRSLEAWYRRTRLRSAG
jgi:UTP:GlnB (protein PII) uridylyltransferase